jgi:glycosyltransferase involved in cell wall biosynthesis
MKVLFLTKYEYLGASSRYRTLQYLPFLKKIGIEFKVSPLFSDDYIKYKYKYGKSNKFIVLKNILNRIKTILFDIYKYDLVVIEKELIPYFPPIFEYYLKLIRKPYIVDYDDAIWHNYDKNKNVIIRFLLKNKIKTVMRLSKTVIAGSEYIVNYAKKSGAKKIVKIPTVIDLNKYICEGNENTKLKNNKFIIGWIGSPSTSKYILNINKILSEFTSKYNTIVHLIGFDKRLENKLSFSYRIIDWSEDTEIKEICKFDVGIMPLIDGYFERGKCGFKLIQYMGCKKPVIASPIGENNIIVEHGKNGFLASNSKDWFEYLKILLNHPQKRKILGKNGFLKVKEKYSLKKAKEKYISLIIETIDEVEK